MTSAGHPIASITLGGVIGMSGLVPELLIRKREGEDRSPVLSLGWAIGIAMAVAYGSLIPFRFEWSFLLQPINSVDHGLRFRGTNLEDLATNIAIYLSVGITIFLATTCRRIGSAMMMIFVTTFLGFCLSMGLEFLQIALPSRVASLTDVLLNTTGTLFGALTGAILRSYIPRFIEMLRFGLSANPSQTLARLLTVGLVLFMLLPFDFALDSASMHESFRMSQWELGRGILDQSGGSLFAALAKQFTAAAWFAVLCYLFAKARLSSEGSSNTVWLSAVRHGVIVASLIELLQLFSLSHTFDLSSLLLRCLASGFGAWCAVLIPASMKRFKPSGDRRLAIRTPVLVGLCAFQIATMQLSCIDTDLISLQTLRLSSVYWMPFEALWGRPMSSAGAQVLETIVAYGTLAATLGIVLRRADVKKVWIITGFAVLWIALTVETLQLAAASGTADVTNLVLALLAVAVVARVFSIFRPIRLPEPALVDPQGGRPHDAVIAFEPTHSVIS